MFIYLHRLLTLPRATLERPVQQELAEEEAINKIENSPSTSIRGISNRVHVNRLKVWGTLDNFGLYNTVQHLQPADYDAARVD